METKTNRVDVNRRTDGSYEVVLFAAGERTVWADFDRLDRAKNFAHWKLMEALNAGRVATFMTVLGEVA